ncbi:MAG: segregation/condensation protein A [Candidatus Micrarchaeia archaeon]
MATQETIDLERIVEKPTWRQILMDLIIAERLDPWNIDIIKISDGFLKRVREMKKLDLLVPANVILASAILLRYKSSYLRLYEPQPELVMAPSEEGSSEDETIPQLVLSSRIPPKRQITMEELEGEIERVIKYDGAPYVQKHKGGIEEFMDFKITGEDIEKKMDEIYERINMNKDENGWALFSVIVKDYQTIDTVYTLLSILHMTQKEVLDIKQDKIFGELLIHVNGKKLN